MILKFKLLPSLFVSTCLLWHCINFSDTSISILRIPSCPGMSVPLWVLISHLRQQSTCDWLSTCTRTLVMLRESAISSTMNLHKPQRSTTGLKDSATLSYRLSLNAAISWWLVLQKPIAPGRCDQSRICVHAHDIWTYTRKFGWSKLTCFQCKTTHDTPVWQEHPKVSNSSCSAYSAESASCKVFWAHIDTAWAQA